MKDVAKAAGVSFKTVSRVLNEDTAVREETRAKVMAAIEALDYRPNIMARSLRSQRTHTIGFVSDVIASTPYASRIIQGAQERAWENNYLLLLVNTGGNQEMKQTAVDTLLDRQVDGIIYATMYHREVHPPENIREVPTMLIDCYVADQSLPSVVPNEHEGGYNATLHLLQKGHRRIGFICDTSGVQATFGRLEGYKQALADHDIPFDPALTCFLGESVSRSGYMGAKAMMQMENPPTALFCYNDRMAMGAYDAMRSLNLSIPNDVAIVGFDNQDLVAADLEPGLTTMALPHYEMGSWGVDHLIHLIKQVQDGQSPTAQPEQKLLNCPLIERAST
ncbi:MAG: LacI family DNA-binding transcriptional regulator [Anaerolineaceae bacterium]|nr:LacI family DNA-binding transcriptional regulator [Anaerolineaceae bacterium]